MCKDENDCFQTVRRACRAGKRGVMELKTISAKKITNSLSREFCSVDGFLRLQEFVIKKRQFDEVSN
jgi:hypothetical protein